MRSLLDSSCAVTGTAGYLLPRFFIKFVQVLRDRELLAARRAAHGNLLSTDLEHHFLTADLALHRNLDKRTPATETRRHREKQI
jgi:hypothetical protein